MRTHSRLNIKVGFSIIFILVFAFSLLFIDFTISHNFTHIYSEGVSEDVYDVETSFATKIPNAATIGICYALVLAVATSNINLVLQHAPNFAALSRAPPL